MHAILNGLPDLEYVKVVHRKTMKEVWDKLQNVHEGDDMVKQDKLPTHISQFESLKMEEEENIVAFLLQVDGVVHTIKGLGEIVDESIIVQKILRSLPLRFDAKVSTLEEIKDLNSLTIDELHGILTAYEMRTGNENPLRKEVAFKASKGPKQKNINLMMNLNQMKKNQFF